MMQPEHPLASVERTADGWTVVFVRRLAHRPDKVWRALTESEHLRHWMPCDIVGERREGATIELPFWPAHNDRYGPDLPTLAGVIRVWDPPRVLKWSWDTDVLRFELEPTDDGTTLTFTTHLGPDDQGAANTAAGYHACLDNLVELLDTGTAPPLVDVDAGTNEERYGAAVAAALRP